MMIPKTVEEACSVQHPTYIGGGTDIMPLLKNRVRDDRNLVFLHKIPELKLIQEEENLLYLGAGVTLHDIAVSPLLNQLVPAVAQAASQTASPQIRNVATLGGNIMQDRRCIYFNQSKSWRNGLPYCFKTGGKVCLQIPNSPVCRAIYYSDVATALLLYDTSVEYVEDGVRKWAPLDELISRHSQANGLACGAHLPVLVLRFRVPKPPMGEHSGFFKYAMRTTIDFPILNYAMRFGGGRPAAVVAGAVAPCPVRMPETARVLDQEPCSEDALMAACEAELKKLAMPIREACITPAGKRELYRQIVFLLRKCRAD